MAFEERCSFGRVNLAIAIGLAENKVVYSDCYALSEDRLSLCPVMIPLISFIVPTKDRPWILQESMSRLLEAVGSFPCEILIINDSKSGKPQLELNHPFLRILDNPGQGVASARNFGAENAKGEILWFLDDDIWLNKSAFERGVELVKKYPQTIFNFNWVYPPSLEAEIQHTAFGRFLSGIGFTTMKGWCRGMAWEDHGLFKTDSLAGATLLLPASVYKEVKGYDASFPLAGFEDFDFSVRVSKAGFSAYIDTTVCVYHNEVSKTSLRGFLQRTFNNAITRRHAVEIGYKEQELKFSFVKVLIFKLTIVMEKFILFLFDRPSLPRFLDPLTAKVYELLIGSAIFKGYTISK